MSDGISDGNPLGRPRTREELLSALEEAQRFGQHRTQEVVDLSASLASARSEVARLTTERDEARKRLTAEEDLHAGIEAENVGTRIAAVKRASAAEATAEQLRSALREIAASTSDAVGLRAIASAALAAPAAPAAPAAAL